MGECVREGDGNRDSQTSCHLRWVADRLGSARGRGSSGMLFPCSAPVLRSVLLYSRRSEGEGAGED